MSTKLSFLFLLLSTNFYCGSSYSQDERALKYLLRSKKEEVVEKVLDRHHFKMSSDWYEIDLNDDKVAEFLNFEKIDGIDHIVIRNAGKKIVFKRPFLSQAVGGLVHKVRYKTISKTTKMLLIYYFEGVTEYINFQSSGRLYFVTWENNDLSTFNMSRGPFYWQESKNYKGNYFQRKYDVLVQDYNGDGTDEVAVKFHQMSRVYGYDGKGTWRTLPPD